MTRMNRNQELEILDTIDSKVEKTETPVEETSSLAIIELIYALLEVAPPTCGKTTAVTALLKKAKSNELKKRMVATSVLRCLDKRGILLDPEANTNEAQICDFLEESLPDISKYLKIQKKDQTYEKINKFETFHKLILKKMETVIEAQGTTNEILEHRRDTLITINLQPVKSYLTPFGIKPITSIIKEVFELLSEISKNQESTFYQSIKKLKDKLDQSKQTLAQRKNTLYNNIFSTFIKTMDSHIVSIEASSESKFKAEISPQRKSSDRALKRYPLYEKDREIIIEIPMENKGNGTATETVANITCHSRSLIFDEVCELGDIEQGRFTLCIYAIVDNPTEKCKLFIEIEWRSFGESFLSKTNFDCTLNSQKVRTDWDDLDFQEPYSTEVATWEEFVGRRSKIANIVKRIIRSRMQSTYISGQKRVGKTSLAQAAKVEANLRKKDININFLFLEWGDYSNPDPILCINNLAYKIYRFFKSKNDAIIDSPPDFNGSLSALVEYAYITRKTNPNDRFVIVLDEFDEIHSEMYRHGAIAETFFSNIRSLSSKDNIAFILIGGENMPFIIGAQGDQLNKFVHEPLSYFSKEKEWNDYVELIRKPTEGVLNWYDESISYLYQSTNGHPYYTKLICSDIYAEAIHARDSDITLNDVQASVKRLASELDTNSFSHFWKDGIQSGREEEKESISLKRCKVLLTVCDILRKKGSALKEELFSPEHNFGIDTDTIQIVLDDLERRSILFQRSGTIEFCLPFFRTWMIEEGYRCLIPDMLSDEFLAISKKAEEELRISSREIVELAKKIPVYKGRKISDEEIRAWIDQEESLEDRRLLFKILSNVSVVSHDVMSESLRDAYSKSRQQFPRHVITSKHERRRDIAIVYVDGEGKSGQLLSRRYAEENKLSTQSITKSDNFSSWIKRAEDQLNVTFNGIVIIDDIAVTGKSLSSNLDAFIKSNKIDILNRNIHISSIVLYGTERSAQAIQSIQGTHPDISFDFYICNHIEEHHMAFHADNGTWQSAIEKEKAIALCRRIGTKVYPRHPLGYGEMSLTIVFPDNCPNNSLPILHSGGKGEGGWKPIFPRIKR